MQMRFLAFILLSITLLMPFNASAEGTDNSKPPAEQNNDPWSKLTEENPITIDPAGGKAGFVGLPSADTTIYYARYNKDIYFKFPRNYLFQLSNITYGHSKPVVTFLAEMFYPDFVGATPETVQQFDFRSWAKSPNIIRVIGPFPDYGHPNKTILSMESDGQQQQAEYGLMKVTHHPVGKNTNAYFVNDPKLGGIAFRCEKPEQKDVLPICDGQINITDDYQIRYQFHRDLLPHWREIYEHVNNFINASLRKG